MVKKKLFITGGLGFIGGRISLSIQNSGKYDVVVATRQKKEELPDEIFNSGIQIIDYFSINEEERLSFLNQIDGIIHLASLNEIDSVKYPKQAILFNVWETVRLLHLAQLSKIKTFLYFSTVHVYGSPLIGVLNESVVCRSSHPYSITHKAAEDYVLSERDKSDMNAVCIRLSNAIGAPAFDTSDRWTLLVNDICKQTVTENKILLISNGEQYRDFITLEDVEQAVLLILNQKKEALFDGIINLASEKALKVKAMAEIVKQCYSGLNSKDIPIIPGNKEDLPNESLKIDIQRLRALGYSPQNNFEKEIKALLSFCVGKFNV